MEKKGTPACPPQHGPSGSCRIQEGLPAARPADTGAQAVEFLGILEELDDLLEINLGLVGPGHVGEGDHRLVGDEHPGLALAKLMA